MEWTSEGTISFFCHDKKVASLQVVGTKTFSVLSLNASGKDYSVEQIRVKESVTYEWRLVPVVSGVFRVRESQELKPSRLNANYGLFQPGNNVGLYSIILEDADGQECSEAYLEIEPVKIGCRDDFHQMLADIADVSVDVLLKLGSNPRVRLDSDWQARPTVVAQTYGVLRSILRSSEFRVAMEKILAHPHCSLRRQEDLRAVGRGGIGGRLGPRAFLRSGRRVRLPVDLELVRRLGGDVSIPASLSVIKHIDTVDTEANQFVKHVLTDFLETAAVVERLLSSQAVAGWLVRDAEFTRQSVESLLAEPIFRDISIPRRIDLGSPVLQRQAGYRELLRSWLRFHSAANLSWEPSKSIYTGGLRDIASLYEYWVFFRLFKVFQKCSSLLLRN